MSRALSELRDGNAEHRCPSVVGLSTSFVCRGSYPETLLDLWDTWADNDKNDAQNERPDNFASEQAFLVLAYTEGGSPLEYHSHKSIREV